MKKFVLLAVIGVALLATPAFADVAGEIAAARAEAVTASTATDMETIQMHLHRGINCLANPDSGSYIAAVGTPCSGQGEGAISDTALPLQKKRLGDAQMTMASGCNQSAIADAQRRARQAITQLDQAKATAE